MTPEGSGALIVLDTSVLVSGLFSPFGAPGRVLDLVLAGRLALAYDDRVLGEYIEVLARPKFRLNQKHVRDLLAYIVGSGTYSPAPPLLAPASSAVADPDNLAFLEVAMASRAAALVTGSTANFPDAEAGVVLVLTPARFVVLWAEAGSDA